jgi:CheY-like chemotaxis protein
MQAAELSDLHRRKDEFLAMLSHELRNPLAPLLNAVQLLGLQKNENQLQRQARTVIERQVTQLTLLVDDLLEVSRMTTGHIQFRPERLVVNDILEHAIETTRPLLEQHRHEVTVSLSPEPIWLDADAARLEQIVVNLLTNAAKYTTDGGQVWLTAEQDGQECVLTVRDTGVGISPELLPRIFDLFTQGEQSLARSKGGLGIGLALVQRLTQLHGGTIEAHSALGNGSEFVVRLPIATSQPAPQTDPESTEPINGALRVLVVDDNVDATQTMSMLLKSYGHSVRTAHDGATAIDVALNFLPSVVLLDIGLPGMDGYEVAKRIRQQPTLEDILLVALTGYGQEMDRETSLQAGFDYHLVKPADFRTVQQILAIAAERSEGK